MATRLSAGRVLEVAPSGCYDWREQLVSNPDGGRPLEMFSSCRSRTRRGRIDAWHIEHDQDRRQHCPR
jgi:hypothetical protein